MRGVLSVILYFGGVSAATPAAGHLDLYLVKVKFLVRLDDCRAAFHVLLYLKRIFLVIVGQVISKSMFLTFKQD